MASRVVDGIANSSPPSLSPHFSYDGALNIAVIQARLPLLPKMTPFVSGQVVRYMDDMRTGQAAQLILIQKTSQVALEAIQEIRSPSPQPPTSTSTTLPLTTSSQPQVAEAATPTPSPTRNTEFIENTSKGVIRGEVRFGAAEWKKYFGEVGEEPSLPDDVVEIDNAPCPFSNDPTVKVKDTHMWVLIPATVNGISLTLNTFQNRIQNPLGGGYKTDYKYYFDKVKKYYGDDVSPASHWVLMTRDVIPGSRNKLYKEQEQLISGYAGYTLPPALAAAVCLSVEHVISGVYLCPKKPQLTHTRCVETFGIEALPVVVGSFGSAGLYISYSTEHGYEVHGAIAFRRFSALTNQTLAPHSPKPSITVAPIVATPSPQLQLAKAATTRNTEFIENASQGVIRGEVRFGAKEWKKYIGDVGKEPPLPPNVAQIDNAPCPFSNDPNIKVKDTHMWVLIPSKVKGESFTLEGMMNLANQKRPTLLDTDVSRRLGRIANPDSYWVLMTRAIIPWSKGKDDQEKKDYLERFKDYQLPKALEVATCLFVEFLASKTLLIADGNEGNYNQCTFCEETFNLESGSRSVFVGHVHNNLWVDNHSSWSNILGICAIRRFQATFSSQEEQKYVATTPKLQVPKAASPASNSRRFILGNLLSSPSLVVAQTKPRATQFIENTSKGSIRGEVRFGAAEWKKYFGDVDEEPSFPTNVKEIDNAPCPFSNDPQVKVKDTHMWVLIPPKVNGVPLTLNTLQQIIQKPLGDGRRNDFICDGDVDKEFGNIVHTTTPYWALMTRDVIPESRNIGYADQMRLMEGQRGYTLPKALAVAVCLSAEYVTSGTLLYPRGTFTRCTEAVQNDACPVVMGGFSDRGNMDKVWTSSENRFRIINSYFDDYSVGAAAFQEFPAINEGGAVSRLSKSSQKSMPQSSGSSNSNLSAPPTSDSKRGSLLQKLFRSTQTDPSVFGNTAVAPALMAEPSSNRNVEFVTNTSRGVIRGEMRFGAAKWKQYFGNIGVEPSLPDNAAEIDNAPCPFSNDPNIKVKDTHMWVLVPAKINGESLTHKSFPHLIQKPMLKGRNKNYTNLCDWDRGYWEKELEKIEKSYWVLMTKDVIPGSRNKGYNSQESSVESHAGYTLPTDLEAAVCLSVEFAVSGTHPFGDGSQWIFTRCKGSSMHFYAPSSSVIGACGSSGFGVSSNTIDGDGYGVAALRRF